MMIVKVKNKEEANEFEEFLTSNCFDYTLTRDNEYVIDSLYYVNIYPSFPSLEYETLDTYKIVSRINHFKRREIKLPYNKVIGGNAPLFIIGGPCSIETIDKLDLVASSISYLGASGLRGGAYKPRTSPYSFQGLGEDGLKMIQEVSSKYNLPSVSEITSIDEIPLFEKYVDIIQVGARNMQNFALLKALGQVKKPILLKRGFGNTIDEFLNAAEYIALNGNLDIILCERGIRSFEHTTRATLDLSSVSILKRLTNLPVIVDPSHAIGDKELVLDSLPSVIMSSCDGIMMEVHPNPLTSISDGHQSLTINDFEHVMEKVKTLEPFIERK